MKKLFRILLLFFFLGQQNSEAQTAPVITYNKENSFTVDKTIIPLIPSNTGGIINGYEVSTFAGNGSAGSTDGIGTVASFYVPAGIVVDDAGNVYVADDYNHKIRKITPSGMVSTFAGSGDNGATNGAGSIARFSYPVHITRDHSGDFLVSDIGNYRIRKISAEGVVSNFAGSGIRGFANGTIANASFNIMADLAFDSFENLYVVDAHNQKIRKITPEGVVSTFAGSGELGNKDGSAQEASFDFPRGIAIDASNNLYIADVYNNKIRKITPEGLVTTFAGSGDRGAMDGSRINASFSSPVELVFDKSGNLLIADINNHKIRKITPEGLVTTIAGTGERGAVDGLGSLATFVGPNGLEINNTGDIFVSTLDNKIRKIIHKTGSYVIQPVLPQGLLFNSETGVISGKPTVLSPLSVYTITATNEGGASVFTITIEVNDIPPLINYPTPNVFIQNETITVVNVNNSGGGVLSYTVVPNLPSGLSLDATTGSIYGTPITAINSTTYTITASNSGGTSSFDIEISIKDPMTPTGNEILISEAITPNGDHINDVWIIKNIENYKNSVVRVYNRWGTEVFFAKNYQNDWDGHYQNNSQSLPEASSYFYQIDLDGDGSNERQGWIYITK